MIIPNFLVGYDKDRSPLYSGDVVRFENHPEDWNEDNKVLEGMIVYDEDVFGFVFYTLDEEYPAICMNAETINRSSLRKIINGTTLDCLSGKQLYPEWAEMYTTHLRHNLFSSIGPVQSFSL